MSLEQSKVLQQFGVNISESKRYRDVASLVGKSYAELELQRNLKSYEREFLMDEAVSLPHTYYHRHNELYSQDSNHPLFNIKKQIDGRERDGVTLDGFTKFENIIASAPLDTVSLWYSPDGPSGFEGVTFDSGRLYFNFKTDEASSVNFDIKVQPGFPVLPFLGQVHQEEEGMRPQFDSPETGKMYYLAHPLTTGMKTQEFFSFMEQYASGENSPLYVSRRNSKEPMVRTMSSAIAEMRLLLEHHSQQKQSPIIDPPGDRTITALMEEEDLMRKYLAIIAPYVDQNDGSFTLYGCSTTSTVTNQDIQGMIASHSVEGLVSMYSTERRLLTNQAPQSFESAKDRYENYTCPHCNASIQGELRGKPETWKTECPSCHGKLHCAN